MRILLKCPSRSRPSKVLSVLTQYLDYARQPDLLGICISCDTDDTTMNTGFMREELPRVLYNANYCQVFFSDNTTKIQACNADMDKITWPWDIVVLVSDDMIPQMRGYDDIIRMHMMARFPDTNGIVWVNDGEQGQQLNTLTIMGRAMYNQFGYIYNPLYKSLFCDTEFTDFCNESNTVYVPYTIIRHVHPSYNSDVKFDALYIKNQLSFNDDMHTYIDRKSYPYDWSILIPTIPGREASLGRLIAHIHSTRQRVCPDLRIEICLEFDNREKTIGEKRNILMKKAKGKYISFIDDDDMVTDAYFEDAVATIRGNYDVCRLRGRISQYTFTHSIAYTLDTPMANEDTFLRPPNHLNIMLKDAARMVYFASISNGEDFMWCMKLSAAGLLSKEYTSDPSRIHYIYELGARTIDEGTIRHQQTTTLRNVGNSIENKKPPPPPPPPADAKKNGIRFTAKGFVSK